ncbi:hypothetical protein HC928_18950 [bacterium]|nr:hypothetical protein [bacterium]
MHTILEQVFASLASQLPQDSDAPNFRFLADMFPVVPEHLSTDNLSIIKGVGAYDVSDSFTVDWLGFEAPKQTYRCLGLLILALVLQPTRSEVQLHLRHPRSDIKQIIIRHEPTYSDDLDPGLHMVPRAFVYRPASLERDPFFDSHFDSQNLPSFWLTNMQEFVQSHEQRQQRDTVIGFGSSEGSAALVGVLLDASLAANEQEDFDLRWGTATQRRSVGDYSAAANFFILPE